jgi:hypothetical protein
MIGELPIITSETPKVDADAVRELICDYAEDNAPLFEEVLRNDIIDRAILDIIDDFNESPPNLIYQYTVYDFPAPGLLKIGAAWKAMRRTAIKEQRRELSYDDGGVQNNLYYKTPQYTGIMQDFQQDYEQKKMRIKRQMNIAKCYGGMS